MQQNYSKMHTHILYHPLQTTPPQKNQVILMQIWPFFPFMKRPLFPKQERFYWDLWQAKRALQNEKCSAMSAVGPLELLSSVSCCV